MSERRVDVVATADDDLRCPDCGNDDLQTWAEDGEADLADWYECKGGTWGAILDPDDHTKTQNGYSAWGVERLAP